MKEHDKTVLTLLSLLLQYPESPCPEHGQLRQIASELKFSPIQNHVHGFLDYLEHTPWEQLAQHYVATFDFSEQSTMDLTALLCPDDRKRGQVLATLKGIYTQAGLAVDSGELPDYLPMILEFLSMADREASKEVLGIVRPGMEKLWQQLIKDGSPYAGVLEACLLSTASMSCPQNAPEGGVL
ncbi:MAG: nitrate reductase molybdenum cofactor assembly chaperone [Sporomusaceae bacterium]|nr:nitrate reductase molybdenum cofactor assembly chaperone [Sporomusaceae bacterium]